MCRRCWDYISSTSKVTGNLSRADRLLFLDNGSCLWCCSSKSSVYGRSLRRFVPVSVCVRASLLMFLCVHARSVFSECLSVPVCLSACVPYAFVSSCTYVHSMSCIVVNVCVWFDLYAFIYLYWQRRSSMHVFNYLSLCGMWMCVVSTRPRED